jgi:integrase
MHTLRHTAAMRLLQASVDVSVIALWLGHQHTSTPAAPTSTSTPT